MECMQAAYDAGCNFFDNAEAYAGGESEAIMGEALAELGWPRWSYVLTTKVFWGIHDDREHEEHAQPQVPDAGDRRVARAARPRLRRRPLLPPRRPGHALEETVWAMSDIVSSRQGAVLGHERVGGRRDPRGHRDRRAPPPAQAGDRAAAVQPAERERVEHEYAGLFDEIGYGDDDLEPAGLGPAHRQVPRRHPRGLARRAGRLRLAGQGASATRQRVAKVEQLRPIADELGCSLAQLALAWCTKNPNVSTVITGASRAEPGRRELRRPRRRSRRSRRRPRPHRRRRRTSSALDSLQIVRTADDKLPIKMLNDRLLVRIPDKDGERRSQGGILIPATAQMAKRLVWAEVVALGQNVRSAEVGDLVLFSPEDRYEVEVQGSDYIMLRERDLHAVAAERIEASTGLYL